MAAGWLGERNLVGLRSSFDCTSNDDRRTDVLRTLSPFTCLFPTKNDLRNILKCDAIRRQNNAPRDDWPIIIMLLLVLYRYKQIHNVAVLDLASHVDLSGHWL